MQCHRNSGETDWRHHANGNKAPDLGSAGARPSWRITRAKPGKWGSAVGECGCTNDYHNLESADWTMKSRIPKFRDVVSAARFGLLWSKAQNFTAQHKYKDALDVLEKAYATMESTIPSDKVSVETNILSAIVAAGLGNESLAVQAARVALGQMDVSTFMYSNDDIKYLKYYCKWVIDYCGKFIGTDLHEESLSIGVSFNDINFDKVRFDIKNNFPIYGPLSSDIFIHKTS